MFGFPKADRSIAQSFNNNFLRQVIWQIQFPPNDIILTHRERIASKFRDTLTKVDVGMLAQFEIQGGPIGPPVIRPKQSDKHPSFILSTEDDQKSLTITNDSVTYTVEGPSYKNFEKLSEEIENIYNTLVDCNIQVVNRVAIRKINLIKFSYNDNGNTPGVDFNSFVLNSSVKTDFNNFPNRHLINQAVQSVNYLSNDGALNLKYGLIVPEKGNINAEYVIDIDLFKQHDVVTNDLRAVFSSLNEEIFNIFFWLLSSTAKSSLGYHADTPTNT